MELRVSSEIGHLNGVIVHTPGKEVTLVGPEIKDQLLFDDIIYESDAKHEHENMLRIFKTIMPGDGKIHEITDLLSDCFNQEEARAFFVSNLVTRLPELNLEAVESDLMRLEATELLEFALLGQTSSLRGFNILPSPNILFTRDLAAVINDGIIISRAARRARARESLMMEMLVDYHPLFKSFNGRSFRLAHYDSIEGGDILVVNKKIVIIGMSERSSFSGIMKAARAIFDYGVEQILIVDIPKQRSSMHLDTIFTFTNANECIVFPPAITDRKDNVVCLSKDHKGFITRTMPSLKLALEELTGHPFTFIKCGGDNPITQSREQWTDGANVFALAPGIIVGYERNTETFAALEEHGYTIMNQFDFVEQYQDNPPDTTGNARIAITFTGNELCRGRGGARCMTMPISRKDI